VLGYQQVFLGYDESRVVEFFETELRMHAEQMGAVGAVSSSSSSSSSSSAPGPLDLLGSLMQDSERFVLLARGVKEEEQRKRKRQQAAARQAKRQAKRRTNE
jgi:hypothetical protein